MREYNNIIVGSQDEYDALVASKESFQSSKKGELQVKE
jgi:hypothetical protein